MTRFMRWLIPDHIAPDRDDKWRVDCDRVIAQCEYGIWRINRNLALIDEVIAQAEATARRWGFKW